LYIDNSNTLILTSCLTNKNAGEYIPFFIHGALPAQTDGIWLRVSNGEVTNSEIWRQNCTLAHNNHQTMFFLS